MALETKTEPTEEALRPIRDAFHKRLKGEIFSHLRHSEEPAQILAKAYYQIFGSDFKENTINAMVKSYETGYVRGYVLGGDVATANAELTTRALLESRRERCIGCPASTPNDMDALTVASVIL